MPISLVRALTENASTPAMPTAAMITASTPNDVTSAALSRRGATLSSRIWSTVSTFSIGPPGATLRTTRVAAGTSAGASSRRGSRAPRPSCPDPDRTDGRPLPAAPASSPPSFVSPTTPTTVRQSPLTGMKRSTSPVHATRCPIGSRSGKSLAASVWLRITTSGLPGAIGRRELPALDQRNARGAEVCRVRRAILGARHRLSRGERPYLRPSSRAGHRSRAERHRRAESHIADPGNRPDLEAHALVESLGVGLAAPGPVERDLHGEHAFAVEAGVHLRRGEASCE